MKHYIYRGLDNEKVPKDVTHVIVDNSVTVIKKEAFFYCFHLVCVIMGDNVKRIEDDVFYHCHAFGSFDFPRRWNTLDFMLSVVVNLWRLCSFHRHSN